MVASWWSSNHKIRIVYVDMDMEWTRNTTMIIMRAGTMMTEDTVIAFETRPRVDFIVNA